MDVGLLNKLSNLTLYGFYDETKEMITVHFFNKDEVLKNDVIAYLNPDMTWDVREVVKEESVLRPDKEIITMFHNSLGVEQPDSQFDSFVRKGLEGLGRNVHGEEADLATTDIMYKILENNSY